MGGLWQFDRLPANSPAGEPRIPGEKSMKVSQDREQLAVKNKNSRGAKYKFSLNFVDGERSDGHALSVRSDLE